MELRAGEGVPWAAHPLEGVVTDPAAMSTAAQVRVELHVTHPVDAPSGSVVLVGEVGSEPVSWVSVGESLSAADVEFVPEFVSGEVSGYFVPPGQTTFTLNHHTSFLPYDMIVKTYGMLVGAGTRRWRMDDWHRDVAPYREWDGVEDPVAYVRSRVAPYRRWSPDGSVLHHREWGPGSAIQAAMMHHLPPLDPKAFGIMGGA